MNTVKTYAQTRDKKRLAFHFNASLTTLNLSKAEHLKTHWDTPTKPFSMTSIKACYFNTFFLQKIFAMFDLDLKCIKKSQIPISHQLWQILLKTSDCITKVDGHETRH